MEGEFFSVDYMFRPALLRRRSKMGHVREYLQRVHTTKATAPTIFLARLRATAYLSLDDVPTTDNESIKALREVMEYLDKGDINPFQAILPV
jgi:hypothetical protein